YPSFNLVVAVLATVASAFVSFSVAVLQLVSLLLSLPLLVACLLFVCVVSFFVLLPCVVLLVVFFPLLLFFIFFSFLVTVFFSSSSTPPPSAPATTSSTITTTTPRSTTDSSPSVQSLASQLSSVFPHHLMPKYRPIDHSSITISSSIVNKSFS